MKKLILMFLAIGMGAGCISAATQLRLTLADGTTPTYTLSEKPTVTFPGTQMVIATPEASVSYNRADIMSMDFGEAATGIENVFSFDDDAFGYIDGIIASPGSEIIVYNISGLQVLRGYESLSTNELSAGIYVAKTARHTVKFIKK
ncbi:MAG: T9SS type A sorting domain-containing protein [Muribaculaceae bacterium]|nr:T9SS type A sorting domain-containing protein [Muribaculaceae bacterium]